MRSKIFEDVKAMQELVDVLPVALFVKDAASRFQLMNKACEAQWGMRFADLSGTDASQFFPPEQMEWFLAKDREIFAGGSPVDFEETFWNAALQQNRIGHTFKKPIYDESGNPLYLICVTVDITEGKQSLQDLSLSEEKLRTMFDMSPLGMARNAMDGSFIEANSALLNMVGYSLQELNRLSYWDLTPERYAGMEAQQLESLKTKGRYGPYEKEYINSRGQHVPVRLNGVQITGSDGEKFIWSIVEDVTERRRSEEQLRNSNQRFEAVLHALPDLMFELDRHGRYLNVWGIRGDLLAAPESQLLGRTVAEMLPPAAAREVMAALVEAEANDHSFGRQIKLPLPQGDCWFELSVAIQPSSATHEARFIVLSRNITERKLAEEKLQLAALVYENSSEGMMVTDGDNRIIDVNPAFTRVTGYALEEVLGKQPSFLNSGRQDSAFYRDMFQAIKTSGCWQGEMWNRRKNGEVYAEWQSINTIFNADGTVHRHVALFSDITQKKASEELIWKQANFDTLTKLPNRRMFHDRLAQELKKSARNSLPLALMFIDLDHFKEVNDTLGHDQGDLLLIEAARRISECVRDSDTVARLGGDEFTVILTELEDIDCVDRIAQHIIDKLTGAFVLQKESVFVSASIGITFYPGDADEIEALLKNADQAMYVAKNAGRNRFSYFTPALQEAAVMRMRLTSDLRSALEEKQFRVYYQPIVEMATGKIHKAEALIRWLHPERGMVSPVQFIPLAEESGLIHQIGDWVFHETARQVKHWRETHAPMFQISVNKSPVQFRQNNAECNTNWLAHLAALSLHGQSISIEITEGVLLHAESDIKDKLFALRDAGVQISIDDFGTGYSSLAYLKKFDIDYLKIDQTFVRNLGSDTDDLALCEAIIVMAHKLGLKVIAEGVETGLQRDILARAGCDYAQGFLYSKAVPADEFEKLLAATRAASPDGELSARSKLT